MHLLHWLRVGGGEGGLSSSSLLHCGEEPHLLRKSLLHNMHLSHLSLMKLGTVLLSMRGKELLVKLLWLKLDLRLCRLLWGSNINLAICTQDCGLLLCNQALCLLLLLLLSCSKLSPTSLSWRALCSHVSCHL